MKYRDRIKIKPKHIKPLRSFTSKKYRCFSSVFRWGLKAEKIVQVYKLHWEIEPFFGWWKKYLEGYHLLYRSEYGLKKWLLSGFDCLSLYLALHCHGNYQENISIKHI